MDVTKLSELIAIPNDNNNNNNNNTQIELNILKQNLFAMENGGGGKSGGLALLQSRDIPRDTMQYQCDPNSIPTFVPLPPQSHPSSSSSSSLSLQQQQTQPQKHDDLFFTLFVTFLFLLCNQAFVTNLLQRFICSGVGVGVGVGGCDVAYIELLAKTGLFGFVLFVGLQKFRDWQWM